MSSVLRWLALACAACSSPSSKAPEAQGGSAQIASAPAKVDPSPRGDERFDTQALGALTFELSEGTPAARAHFQRGLLALHSFWYDEAERQFQAAKTADPEMNMAYWGVAMSKLKLLWGEDDVAAARKVLSKMPNPDRLSLREQAWILATVELVRAGDVRTSRQRFLAAMEGLHTVHPDDESKTFLALALLSTTRPEDPDTIAVRKRAAALAAEVYARNPAHPGAAHYLIHAYDTPELAPLALEQAKAYAKIAPEAFHARHMPSHIFSRLGMWSDAIASCHAAWDASLAAARRNTLTADHHDFHSLTWIIEMSFELGKRADADAALARFAGAVRGGLGRQHRALYATEVASYMMRTGAWSRVDELLAPLEAVAVEPPSTDAPVSAPGDTRAGGPSHCAPAAASSPLVLGEKLAVLDARVIAAAMQRDRAGTNRLLAELDEVRAALRPYLASTQPKEALARIDAAHARRIKALRARAAGDDRALVKTLTESAGEVAAEVGGESNPSGFVVHEELGEALLRLDRPKEAAAAFAVALAQHPKRARSLLGAARAASAGNDAATARTHYAQLVELWRDADESTPGLAEARAAATP